MSTVIDTRSALAQPESHSPLTAAASIPLPPSPTLGTPSPKPSPSKTSPTTHIPSIQPHASFFKASRPNEQHSAAAPAPRTVPPSPTSANFTVNITNTPAGGGLRSGGHGHDAQYNSISITSDISTLAARRANKHSRDPSKPLLPIGVVPSSLSRSAPTSPPTSASATRTSFEKPHSTKSVSRGFIMTHKPSADSLSRQSPRPSPLQGQFNPGELEMRIQSSEPRSPRFVGQPSSPIPPRSPSFHSITQHTTKARNRFTAQPPPDAKPFVPLISPKTGKPQRNYEGYPSNNKFYLRGHIIRGGDSVLPFIATLTVTLGVTGTWFGTTAVWWWKNESLAVAIVGAYMCLLTISSMLATAMRDPGILPRNMDPEPPYPATSPSDGSPRMPLPRDLRIADCIVRVKYCTTCKTYRPPRSIHCKACDNCVDACDHHCQWVNNCVGRRNYTSFIVFIVFAALTLMLVIITSALHISIMTHREGISFAKALNKAAGSAVVFCVGLAVLGPLLSLVGFHLRLLILNITTIEQIRNKAESEWGSDPLPPNPFSMGRWYRNVLYMLCRPAGYSWIEPAGVRMEDKREINPGAEEMWREGREGGEREREGR